jgi:hypothetical protein
VKAILAALLLSKEGLLKTANKRNEKMPLQMRSCFSYHPLFGSRIMERSFFYNLFPCLAVAYLPEGFIALRQAIRQMVLS